MLKLKFRNFHDPLTKIVILFLISGLLMFTYKYLNRPIPISFQDRSWLDGVPCSPPCWYGLVPGQSSESDVIAVLTDLDFIEIKSIHTAAAQFFDTSLEEYVPAVYIEVALKMKMKDRGTINFLIADDSLKRIGESLNYDISLQEVVDAIGEPDSITSIEQPQIRGKPFCEIEIFWIEEQMSVLYAYSEKDTWVEYCEEILEGGLVNPSETVLSIRLWDISSKFDLIRPNEIVPWPGFINTSD
jgi:hypothetical protein